MLKRSCLLAEFKLFFDPIISKRSIELPWEGWSCCTLKSRHFELQNQYTKKNLVNHQEVVIFWQSRTLSTWPSTYDRDSFFLRDCSNLSQITAGSPENFVFSSGLHVLDWGKFSTDLSPSGRFRQVQNTTSCHDSGTIHLNSIRISTVRGHVPYKYSSRSTKPRIPVTNSNPLRISWSDTSFSPTGEPSDDALTPVPSRINFSTTYSHF